MLLIGQQKVMWVEGEGGAWRLARNNRREGGEKRGGGGGDACVEDVWWDTTDAEPGQKNRQDADVTPWYRQKEEDDFDSSPSAGFCISKMAAAQPACTGLRTCLGVTLLWRKNNNHLIAFDYRSNLTFTSFLAGKEIKEELFFIFANI